MRNIHKALILFALTVGTLVGCEQAKETPTENPVSQDKIATTGEAKNNLRKQFSATLPPGIVLVDSRKAFDKHRAPRWIVGLRFNEPGFYAIRHSCFEYRLWIGPRGAPRVHLRTKYLDCVNPIACVGDVIELPFCVPKNPISKTFACRLNEPSAAWAASDKELGNIKYLQKHLGTPIRPEGQLAQLDLMAAGADGTMSRDGGSVTYSLEGLFKCKGEGKLLLHASAVIHGKATERNVPVVVVPADKPIRILASRTDRVHMRESGQFTSIGTKWLDTGPVVARVGDYLLVHFFAYKVPGERSSQVTHPTVNIRSEDFGNNTWALGHQPLSD